MPAKPLTARTKTMPPRTPITIDKAVKKPRGIRQPDPDSALSQILKLEVGESWAKCVKLDGETAINSVIVEEKRLLSQTMHSTVGRANKAGALLNEAVYRLVTGEWRAQDGDIVITACVTRIE